MVTLACVTPKPSANNTKMLQNVVDQYAVNDWSVYSKLFTDQLKGFSHHLMSAMQTTRAAKHILLFGLF